MHAFRGLYLCKGLLLTYFHAGNDLGCIDIHGHPNCVTDDVGRKSVTLIRFHQRIIDEQQLTCQYRYMVLFTGPALNL